MKRSLKIHYLSFTVYILFLGVSLYSQQPVEEWVRIYNSPDNMSDQFIDMVLDNNGNIFSTGYSLTASQNNNIIVTKYNSAGVLQWTVSYNGFSNPNDIVRGIAVDSSGNCYIAGYSGFNFGPYDGILIKYSINGDTVWTRKLITPLDDEFTKLAIDNDNNVYVTGRSGDSSLIFKYDSSGNIQWRNRYYESQYRALSGVARLDKDNNVYVGGTKFIPSSATSGDYLVRKYTSSGNSVWSRSYNSQHNNYDLMTGFTLDNFGNSYSTGSAVGVNNTDILTIKISNNGQLEWAKLFNGLSNQNDQANAITCDTSGNNILITGYTFQAGSSTDYITIRYNSLGDTLWTRTYNNTGNFQDEAISITMDKLMNIYVTGESSRSSFDFEAVTIKYSLLGNADWVAKWNSSGTGGDRGTKIIADNFLNIYVGGLAAAGSPNFLDLLIIKYSQVIGINTQINQTPVDFTLYQNYPNPFNPDTKIKFSIPEKSYVQLRVVDVLGKFKEEIVNSELNPAVYEVAFNGVSYASGVYFYQLIADGNIIATKKFILMK